MNAYVGKLSALCDDISAFLRDQGWASMDVRDSPITGDDGNKEVLIGAKKAA